MKKNYRETGSGVPAFDYLLGLSGCYREESAEKMCEWNKFPYFSANSEILLLKSEHCTMHLNNNIYEMKKNDIIIFNSTDYHIPVVESGSYCRYMSHFSREDIEPFSPHTALLLACFSRRAGTEFYPARHLTDGETELVVGAVESIMSKTDTGRYGDDVLRICELAWLLITLNRIYERKDNRVEPLIDETYERIRPVMTYIDNNYLRDITLDDLAAQVHLSKYHVCRLFKKIMGRTPYDYVLFKRMLFATDLLRRGYTNQQVCSELRMCNVGYFVNTFKKVVGMTPRVFCDMNRKYLLGIKTQFSVNPVVARADVAGKM